MKIFRIALLVIITAMTLTLSSCKNEEDVKDLFENTNLSSDIDTDINDKFITQEIQDSLKSVEAYYIGTMNDLVIPMQEAHNAFKKALNRGDFKDYPESTPILTRASVTKHTEYETSSLAMPEDIHKKMFFKSKFSAAVVNKINAVASPEYRISTGTTYCCYWRVYYHKIIKNSNQSFGQANSPQCALHPDTRNSYIERGYGKEETAQADGTTKIELYSFEVVILYKDTNKKTIRLDISYPRDIDPSPWKGYEFSYNILTR